MGDDGEALDFCEENLRAAYAQEWARLPIIQTLLPGSLLARPMQTQWPPCAGGRASGKRRR